MRAVRGTVVTSNPVALPKAALAFSRFAASEASGMPADTSALVLCAAEAAAELYAFRRAARACPGGEAENTSAPCGDGKRREKKRKKAE